MSEVRGVLVLIKVIVIIRVRLLQRKKKFLDVIGASKVDIASRSLYFSHIHIYANTKVFTIEDL